MTMKSSLNPDLNEQQIKYNFGNEADVELIRTLTSVEDRLSVLLCYLKKKKRK